MKKLILSLILILGMTIPLSTSSRAQEFGLSINIGNQPAWGPTGYNYARYYYFPDINCYYDVNLRLFHFLYGGVWTSADYLPAPYCDYDLYSIYKVVLNTDNPWLYNRRHRVEYSRYIGGYSPRYMQSLIRDSRNGRYYMSRRNDFGWRRQDRGPSYQNRMYNYGNRAYGNGFNSDRRNYYSGRQDGEGYSGQYRRGNSFDGNNFSRNNSGNRSQNYQRENRIDVGYGQRMNSGNSFSRGGKRTSFNNRGRNDGGGHSNSRNGGRR